MSLPLACELQSVMRITTLHGATGPGLWKDTSMIRKGYDMQGIVFSGQNFGHQLFKKSKEHVISKAHNFICVIILYLMTFLFLTETIL